MVEGSEEHRPVQPVEQRPAEARESSLAEVWQLDSKAILDGIYEGTITDPDALLIYFEKHQDEYREEALRQPDEPWKMDVLRRGGWNNLIRPQTDEDYESLAQFCRAEVRRRSERMWHGPFVKDDNVPYTDEELQELRGKEAQRAGNLYRMAEAFRERCQRLAGEASDADAVGGARLPVLPGGRRQREEREAVREPETAGQERPIAPERSGVPRLVIGHTRPLSPRPRVPRLVIKAGEPMTDADGNLVIPRLVVGKVEPARPAPRDPRLVVRRRT